MTLPVIGVPFEYPIVLLGLDGQPLLNPALAAGDFTVSTDGSPFANLADLPEVEPAGSGRVLLKFNAAEMTGSKEVMLLAIDVSAATNPDATSWLAQDVTISLVTGNAETVNDLLQGDRVETSDRSQVFKRGTATELLDKEITGSLLRTNVTITTKDT